MSALTYVTRLAPGVTLDPVGVHVKGGITLSTDHSGGLDALAVATNYVYAYPLRKRGETAVVVLHRKETLDFYHPGSVAVGEEGPPMRRADALWWDTSCSASDPGFLAPSESALDAPQGITDPARRAQRFDPTQPVEAVGSGC